MHLDDTMTRMYSPQQDLPEALATLRTLDGVPRATGAFFALPEPGHLSSQEHFW